MSARTEQEQIIEEAKVLNPDTLEVLVIEIDAFLKSDLNTSELSTSFLNQVSEGLLKKLAEPKKDDEN